MPRQKYLRHLAALRRELEMWHGRYAKNATEVTNLYLQERFTERAEAIERAMWNLDQVMEVLRQLPRTSL